MKKTIRKLLNMFLTLAIVFTMFPQISVFAEEVNDDSSLEEIIEIGTAEEVFGSGTEDEIMLMNEAAIGKRIAYIPNFDSAFGYSYITYISINGQTVFCIEPGILFQTSSSYPENPVFWNTLSSTQKQQIWEICYYGYDYPGHQTDEYYAATQLMIWEIVKKWYDPYTLDGSSYYDVSAQIDEINALRSQPQGKPSFHNQTIKMGLNTPVTVTDTKGVLGNFNVTGGNGISATVNGNSVTYSITSENYSRTLEYGRSGGNSIYECAIIYGGEGVQDVIHLAKRTDPTPNFKINFELLYADIEIEKQDIETGNVTQGDATFNGATFLLKDMSGNTLETLTTNGSKVVSKKYPVGTSYKVCEATPPTGYLPNEACNQVDLTFSGDNTPSRFYTIYTDKVIKGKIEIAKSIEQETNKPYETVIQKPGVGFKFDIFLKSSGEKIATLTTDNEGRAISELLPYGLYVVKEQETTGYDTLKPFEVMIDENEKVYFYQVYNDTLKAELNIYKTDAETGNHIPAAGVEFKIKDANGNYIKQTVTYPNKYETDTFVTMDDGSVHLPEPLIFGEYKIVEIKAPYGYVLKDIEIPFNVDGSTTEIFMNFDNQAQKGQITLEKYGEHLVAADFRGTEYGVMYSPIYENSYLAGVTYEIRAKDNVIGQEGTVWYTAGELVETITTGVNGKITSSKLPLGSYTLKEIETLPGYVLDTTIYDVIIEYAGQEVEVVTKNFTMTNERQKLELELTKTFEDEDKEAYKDVLFGVYAKNDITIPKGIISRSNEENVEVLIPKDGLVGVLTIDENGNNIEQLDLPIGDYYVKELETNVGFELNEDIHNFTFKYGDTTEETVVVKLDEINNTKRRLDLEVTKVDSKDHNHLLNGAIFEVYDKTTGKKVDTLMSGKFFFKGDNKDVVYEIATDENFENIIQVAKTDAEKEIILDIPEGTYYSRKALVQSEDDIDTEFTFNSNPVKKHIVKNGKAVFTDGIYGHKYEFKEIVAPTSYHLSDKALAIKVIANRETNTLTYIFENNRIEVPNTGI